MYVMYIMISLDSNKVFLFKISIRFKYFIALVLSIEHFVRVLRFYTCKCMLFRLLIGRQLFATHGESFMKDLLNNPSFNYLIPEEVRNSIENYAVPDVLAACGDDEYIQAREALRNVITHCDSEEHKFADAVSKFKRVIQNNMCYQPVLI